jgi:hypothetical protein
MVRRTEVTGPLTRSRKTTLFAVVGLVVFTIAGCGTAVDPFNPGGHVNADALTTFQVSPRMVRPGIFPSTS